MIFFLFKIFSNKRKKENNKIKNNTKKHNKFCQLIVDIIIIFNASLIKII